MNFWLSSKNIFSYTDVWRFYPFRTVLGCVRCIVCVCFFNQKNVVVKNVVVCLFRRVIYRQVNNKPHVQIKPTKDHAKSYTAYRGLTLRKSMTEVAR